MMNCRVGAIEASPADVPALDPTQLDAYFALMEAVSLLQHSVEQQLQAEGDLSYVQFQLLARLAAARGQLTMTELADGVVYSRSGLTYQAGLLEKAGLITRAASPDDDRATLVAEVHIAMGTGLDDEHSRPPAALRLATVESATRRARDLLPWTTCRMRPWKPGSAARPA